MGKPKNKNKDRDLAEDDSDVDIVQDTEEDAATESKPATKQSKKDKRRKKKDDDWEDDISNELEALSMEANKGNPDQNGLDEEDIPTPVTKKEKKKKKKATHDSDEEGQQGSGDMEGPGTKTQKKRGQVASFQMLMVDSDDTKSESEKEEEEEEHVVEKQQSKQEKKKEKKKKGKEKKTAEDDDLDALLAEIDKPKEKSSKKSKKDKRKEAQSEAMETEETSTSLLQNEAEGDQKEAEPAVEVVKVEPKVVTMEDLEDEDEDDRKKRKMKKGKKEEKDEGDEQKEGEAEEEEGTMKTAAQKRKEKKEREKLKKMGKKKKEGEGVVEGKTEDKPDVEKQDTAEAGPSKEEKTGEEKADEEDEGEEEGGKKKKKEKKKKGEKEEKKKKPKAPVAAIKELLKKQKEEEERLQREEDEQIRKDEEEYQAKLEAKRLEDEKRLKKREKEKLRKQRLKDEGKLLTEKQKQDKRRAMQLIETMKEQGMEIPQKTEEKKKRPVYYDKKKKKQQHRPEDEHEETETTPSPTESPATTPLLEFAPDLEVKVAEETKVTDEVKVTEDGDDDVKDDWDISSDEETEEKESSPEVEVKKKVEVSVKQEDTKQADADDDVDDESEEDDDDDEEEEEEEESSSEEESESESEDDRTPYERAEEKLQKRHEEAEKNRTTDVLRAPVVCVLGHVDTGKTKILDKLRRTNVQDGEAGGITQQIGATNVPHYALKEKTTMCKEFQKKELKLPGLLIIDTPGHESFSNLRSRGSSLCDIAILVVDIMHGLEPQTIESINLLKDRKTPFLVALNKVDRLYQWKSNPNSDIMNTIKRQTVMCKQEFDERSRDTITQLAEQGLNAALFYENKNPKEYISLVPTSAISGDGMGNLVALICELTQTWLAKKVSYSEELHATVMEVKALPGLGTTIDVILVNGKLREGDQIVMAGTEGPIVTQIRGLLMPQPMKELRVKGQYEHHKEVPAAQGVKLIGKDFEKALAGLPLYVAYDDDEVEYYSEELSLALKHVLGAIKLTERGVFVQASTLGSLEALLEFLRTSKIPYAGINIGPVHKRDIMKASVMLEHDSQYAVILAFDVKVEREAQEMADSVGVTIFTADIIYHLQDKFMAHREQQKKQKQEEFKNIAVFPCKLRVLPQFIFNSRDPIVVGVSVEAGFVKNGTPICVPSREFCFLGLVTSVEINHKAVDMARKGQEVCIKIENIPSETPKLYGRHFEHTDMLVSKISRASIDAVKDHFREQMGKPDWALLVELKKLFQIM